MSTIFRQRCEANGVVFNAAGEAPVGAINWGLDICDGWKDTPDPVVFSTDFGALRDGENYGDYWPVRSKFITVGGYAYAATPQQAEALADVLVRDAFPRNRDLRFTRFEAVPKYVAYRRIAKVEFDWTVVENGFRWLTTLSCPDPFRYSAEPLTGSAGTAGESTTSFSFPLTFPMVFTGTVAGDTDNTVTLQNQGTAPSSHLVVTLTGPLDKGGWRLRNDTVDGEIFFDFGLGVGEVAVLDFATHLVTVNGFPINVRRTGNWWRLAPGPNAVRLYANFNENTTVSVTAESAWE